MTRIFPHSAAGSLPQAVPPTDEPRPEPLAAPDAFEATGDALSIADLVQRRPSPSEPPPGLAPGRGLSVLGQLTFRIVQGFQEPPAELAAFDYVGGDVEAAGFSLGLLRWSLGAGDLQPLLRRFVREFRDTARDALGGDERLALLERLIGAEPSAGVELARRHVVDGETFRDGWGESLTRLAGSDAFRRLQWRSAAAHILQRQTFRELQLLSVEEMQELIDRLSRVDIADDPTRRAAPSAEGELATARRFEPFAGLEGREGSHREDAHADERRRRRLAEDRRSNPHPP